MRERYPNFGHIALAAFLFAVTAWAQPYLMENLGRGVVAMPTSATQVYVGWRMLGTDPANVAFNLYRKTGGGPAVLLNAAPLTGSTNYVDAAADLSQPAAYLVRAVVAGVEQAPSAAFSLPPNAPVQNYLSIPLRTDLGVGARHVGVGDLDGDGEYDFVAKRGDQDIDPSQDTVPTDTYKLEGYLRDGSFLWRVDLGPNIRPGVWTSPFLVFDLDGDGRAEVITKIGESAEDWNGDGITRYSDSQGRDFRGPEWFAVIDGLAGNIRARGPWIERGDPNSWGDNYGNRMDRHLMGVAYLDGKRPSLLIMRGTYTRLYVEAWDYRDGALTRRWRWSRIPPPGASAPDGVLGYHNIRVGDIDGDGKDELIYGSLALDDDGTLLWTTRQGHGDRMHMTDIDPSHPGKEIFYVHETPATYEFPVQLRDARTGERIWGRGDDTWGDVGRGNCADIDPRFDGIECWSAGPGRLYSATGTDIGPRPSVVNFGIWWDADLLRESLDGTVIDKWNHLTANTTRLLSAAGTAGSRSAPMGYGDILGDWREEVWEVVSSRELRIYSTTIPATNRLTTLMHDTDYRTSVACETMGYMQSTQPGFYVGMGMSADPVRPIAVPQRASPRISAGSVVNAASYAASAAPGSLVSIFGENLAFRTVGADRLPWPAELAGASVTVNGTTIPLFFASPGQINGQIPEDASIGTATVVVTAAGLASSAARLDIRDAAPGIFLLGANRAAAQNQNGTLNTRDNPAAVGEVVVVYFTGQGVATPAASATIGGQRAQVMFLGPTPGFIGLSQANLVVPNLTAGDYPVVITLGAAPSNAALIAVR